MDKSRIDNNKIILISALSLFIGWVIYRVVISQLTMELSDYSGHVYVYLPLMKKSTLIEGWLTVPYFAWHAVVLFFYKVLSLPLESAAAFSSACFEIINYLSIIWFFCKYEKAKCITIHFYRNVILSLCLCILQGIYVSWLDVENSFLGIYSMNPLHNPTQMCVQGISIVCFALIYDLIRSFEETDYKPIFFEIKGREGRYILLLAILLLASVLCKPTFAEMIIPTVAFYMLFKLCVYLIKKNENRVVYFKHCLEMLLAALPALIYMLISFLAYYVVGRPLDKGTSVIITDWLEVWHLYSENVMLSIVLGMAFPICVILISKSVRESKLVLLSLFSYIIAFIEAALLGESGGKLGHSNFLWPLMSAMLFVWISTTVAFVTDEETAERKPYLTGYAWLIFFAHVLCGLLYVWELIFG